MHRDIKPQNILLTESRHAKLSDMGLCKRLAIDQSSFESRGPGKTTPSATCSLIPSAMIPASGRLSNVPVGVFAMQVCLGAVGCLANSVLVAIAEGCLESLPWSCILYTPAHTHTHIHTHITVQYMQKWFYFYRSHRRWQHGVAGARAADKPQRRGCAPGQERGHLLLWPRHLLLPHRRQARLRRELRARLQHPAGTPHLVLPY